MPDTDSSNAEIQKTSFDEGIEIVIQTLLQSHTLSYAAQAASKARKALTLLLNREIKADRQKLIAAVKGLDTVLDQQLGPCINLGAVVALLEGKA